MKIKKTPSQDNKFNALPPQSRRQFLRASALSVAAASFASYVGKAQDGPAAAPYVGNVKAANDKINIACIGVGGQGESDTGDILRLSQKANSNVNRVALCDVDQEHVDKMAANLPRARGSEERRLARERRS